MLKMDRNVSILVSRMVLLVYLVLVERCVVDGEKLGARASGVVTVAHSDGAEEDAEPEQRPVGDPKRCARHSHGVQV
jgi:hypothetical protein